MYCRARVVAVLRPVVGVAVVVEVDRVGPAAVLVDTVLGDVGGTRMDPGVAVVAVCGPVRSVAVYIEVLGELGTEREVALQTEVATDLDVVVPGGHVETDARRTNLIRAVVVAAE